MALEVEPELGAVAEKEGKREGGLGADGAFAFDDLIEGGARDAGVPGKLGLGELERFKKFQLQNAPRSGGEDGLLFAGHGGGVEFSGSR